MCESNSSKLGFTAAPVYCFIPEVKKDDAHDQLTARLSQLSALLLAINGDGFENFQNMNAESQQSYLWACRMMALEAEELAAIV